MLYNYFVPCRVFNCGFAFFSRAGDQVNMHAGMCGTCGRKKIAVAIRGSLEIPECRLLMNAMKISGAKTHP